MTINVVKIHDNRNSEIKPPKLLATSASATTSNKNNNIH